MRDIERPSPSSSPASRAVPDTARTLPTKKGAKTTPKNVPVSRIGVSLPPDLLAQLDTMVKRRGYGSRSQAIADMVSYQLAQHQGEIGNDVMVGTITLLYDRTSAGLQKKLADTQFRHIDEVISSLHVQLSHQQVMEVILVQGQARKLRDIADELITQRGVLTGRLHLLAAMMPPIQTPAAIS